MCERNRNGEHPSCIDALLDGPGAEDHGFCEPCAVEIRRKWKETNLQVSELQKQVDKCRCCGDPLVCPKRFEDMNRLNGEMRELIERMARCSKDCKHGFEPGSKHIVPDDCVYVVCQAATFLKLGYLKRGPDEVQQTEKRKCEALDPRIKSSLPCVLDRGHSGEHQDCTGCHWENARLV